MKGRKLYAKPMTTAITEAVVEIPADGATRTIVTTVPGERIHRTFHAATGRRLYAWVTSPETGTSGVLLAPDTTTLASASGSGKKAYGVVDTEAMLRAAARTIAAQPRQPDMVIATGDLTDCGLQEEYELLRDCLRPLGMPEYLIPGNHDRPHRHA